MTQERLHVALNHIPFLGSGIAVIPTVVGLVLRSKATLITGLAMATFFGWITPIVMETGESASERYEEGPVRSFLDANVKQAIESHEERAEKWSKVLYLSAIVSSMALGISIWRFSLGRYVAIVAVMAGLAALGSGVWIAESGGKIRRPDFRQPATLGDSLKTTHEND